MSAHHLNRGLVSIREAAAADAPVIVKMIRELARFEKLGSEAKPDVQCLKRAIAPELPGTEEVVVFLALYNERPIGFALCYEKFSTFLTASYWHLEDIFVRPKFRGLGVGTSLIKQVAQHADSSGSARLDLDVLQWNTTAIAFYESLGFKRRDEWLPMRIQGKALKKLGKK